ncbi:MAG: hypothetical protein ACRD2N_04710 [Vicinamibacterales bacterium]
MKPVVRLATLLFSLVAIGHAARLAFGVSVIIGGWVVPMWLSTVGTIVPAAVALALWREAHSR